MPNNHPPSLPRSIGANAGIEEGRMGGGMREGERFHFSLSGPV